VGETAYKNFRAGDNFPFLKEDTADNHPKEEVDTMVEDRIAAD